MGRKQKKKDTIKEEKQHWSLSMCQNYQMMERP